MNRNFSQTIMMRTRNLPKLLEMLEEWDRNQARGDIMGYMGTRILEDRERPGLYMIIADFGMIDPDVPAAEEAARNNERPETQAIAAAMAEIADEPLEYHDYDELYRTDTLRT
jgi:hypothetical protein